MRFQVDMPAGDADTLGDEQLPLPVPDSLGHGAVRVHDPVPGHARVHAGKRPPDLPG